MQNTSALKVEISELRSRVDVIERRQKETLPTTSFNWSKIVSGKTHRDENAVAMITTITTELKKKKERGNNVILTIPETKIADPNGEAEFAKKLATDMGISEMKIKISCIGSCRDGNKRSKNGNGSKNKKSSPDCSAGGRGIGHFVGPARPANGAGAASEQRRRGRPSRPTRFVTNTVCHSIDHVYYFRQPV
ncbi:hypothetical protein BpHYR1_011467 [Brachionus plicatilis]|uniref:Uncharacterized protein n=1 Tax=Brachionus plicatilis TaxID=10195 RepID=A0A3M7QET8_BRAPC|nr:hypothetical protein BpHYR1_011467 [Brachionus plicatilis]